MGFFKKDFTSKNGSNEIRKREKAITDFNSKLAAIGFNSFRLQVGDEMGENKNIVFINSQTIGNSKIEGFLQNSLLKSHTAANLMSIGFQKIGIIEAGIKRNEFYELNKYV